MKPIAWFGVLATMLVIGIAALILAPKTAGPETTIVVDANSAKPISPFIYGVNHPEWKGMGRGITMARQGGNRMSAYNWETNASNAGSDWHHQNDGYLGESNEAGWTARTFMEAAQKNGAAVLLTVPTMGYVSADKKADGDVNQTPDYINVRFHKSLAKKPGGKFVYPPDTTDKFVYQDEFVAWIEKIKSPSTPVWFSLDNEPDLWGSTHQRVWPKNPTYAQILENNVTFGKAIKDAAPKTLIFGPANYGWMGFRTFQGAPDANGRDFLDFYLSSMKAAEKSAGKRILDVLDIHWYPEAKGDGVRICSNDDKPGTPAARIQASRSLWDPTYIEDSWIMDANGKKPLALIPSIMSQIDKQYPGTKFAVTEYNYGGSKVISGAIAQADVLGIFGRYGVFAASNWGLNPNDTAICAGFHAFGDFDGKGSRFGDLGLAVTGEKASDNAVYAALDSKDKGKMTLVVINKTTTSSVFKISTKGYKSVSGKGYVVTSESLAAPNPVTVTVSSGVVNYTAPALSVTTIELRSK